MTQAEYTTDPYCQDCGREVILSGRCLVAGLPGVVDVIYFVPTFCIDCATKRNALLLSDSA